MSNVLVFAEVNDGVLNDVSLQCLTAARAIAGAGGRVKALLVGASVKAAGAALFAAGADEVEAAEDAALAAYVTRPYRKIVLDWAASDPAAPLLMASSTVGNDLAPAVAAASGAACVLEADRICAEGGAVQVRRIGFDRKVTTTFAPAGGQRWVVTLRDGAAPAPEAGAARSGTVASRPVTLSPEDLVSKVLRRAVAKKTINLKAAKIIVAAGAGVGSADGLGVVRELAQALGAELGATRAVVDAGWLAADHQIGQTGATVRPDLYIACGVSGAVQHLVGMLDARKIVAINVDPNAPIFRVAHYKVAGDLKVVVPKLVKMLKG